MGHWRPGSVWLILCISRCVLVALVGVFAGCGGGGGGSSGPPAPLASSTFSSSPIISSQSSPNTSSSSLASAPSASSLMTVSSPSRSSMPASPSSVQSSLGGSSSLSNQVIITGRVTYDLVPHSRPGLNYAGTVARPGRGLVVELVGANERVLATTLTDTEGFYALSVTRNQSVKVRVKAQLLRNQSPRWDFKVTDNTRANSLYSMSGDFLVATEASAVRDLHAASGWSGAGYTTPRVAAPFAILDSIYSGVERVQAAGNTEDFPALELRWSTLNKAAEGDYTLGEIGTSFFGGDAIYILGDENNDTDEYDRHVILHEWGHYLEEAFSRSDSIGGDHAQGDKMDVRVAMSEGFANAFAAMMLEDASYRDSSGQRQADGFFFDVSSKNNSARGWYSEASVQSTIYNFYLGASGKSARDFTDIFRVISANDYKNTSGFTSIYVFANQLRQLFPALAPSFDSLLVEQDIAITDEFGSGETNSGGFAASLPVYKTLSVAGTSTKVCTTNRFGVYNKLANAQYLRVNISVQGNYQFTVQESPEDSGQSDPDLYLYDRGTLIALAEGVDVDRESFSRTLTPGSYVLELVDARMQDPDNLNELNACFDLRAQLLN